MVENVDGFEIGREGDEVTIAFTDLFGEGEVYRFPLREAIRIRDALITVLTVESE